MKKQYYFNFEEILSFAWTKTKQHAWFLVCTAIIYGIIMSAVRETQILGQIVTLLVALSIISMSLIIVRNESFSFSDLTNRLKSPKLVLKFFALTAIYIVTVSIFTVPFLAAAMIASGATLFNGHLAFVGFVEITGKLIAVLISTLLLFIPAVFVTVRFKFFPYVLLENENLSVLEVIQHTYKLTCCIFWHLLWFFIILSVINILGFLAFGVGIFITVPVSIFALAHLYRQLETHTH